MTLSRRARLAVKVALACMGCLVAVLLAAWAAFVPLYNEWREPDNIFEELYWSCIDEGCDRAVLCEAGPFWPGEYLPAFLNPCRYTGLSRMGATKYDTSNIGSLFTRNNGVPGIISREQIYASFYGTYQYEIDPFFDIETDSRIIVDSFYVEASEARSNTQKHDSLTIGISFTNDSIPKSDTMSSPWDRGVTIVMRIDLKLKTISAELTFSHHIGQSNAERIAKAIIFDHFLTDYLAAYPESKFDKNDLGRWYWREFQYDEV